MTNIQYVCACLVCVYATEPLTLPVPVTSPLGTLYNYTVLPTDRGFSYDMTRDAIFSKSEISQLNLLHGTKNQNVSVVAYKPALQNRAL